MENKNKYLVIASFDSYLFNTFAEAKRKVIELFEDDGEHKNSVKLYQVSKSYSITKTNVVITADTEVSILKDEDEEVEEL